MLFDVDESVWYSPQADRLFIFKRATFISLPVLEREDGKQLILSNPNEVIELSKLPSKHRYKLIYIGVL